MPFYFSKLNKIWIGKSFGASLLLFIYLWIVAVFFAYYYFCKVGRNCLKLNVEIIEYTVEATLFGTVLRIERNWLQYPTGKNKQI
jgi:hypothetical protein